MVSRGEINPKYQKLIDTTVKATLEAINICKPGIKINKIGELIERIAKSEGYYVDDNFVGHGIGKGLHMNPMIRHYYNECDEIMEENMVFTIEPILMM